MAAYTNDDSGSVTATPFDPFSTDMVNAARAGVQPRRNARFLAQRRQHRTVRIFPRRIFLHRRTDSGHARRPRLPGFVGSTSGRSSRRWRQPGVQSAGASWDSREAIMEAICTSLEIFSPTRIRSSITKGRHQFTVGAWFQRFQSNEEIALSQYGQMTFTGVAGFPDRHRQFPVRSYTDAAELALSVRRLVCRGRDTRASESDADSGFPRRIQHRME